jgi:hypothetical protein
MNEELHSAEKDAGLTAENHALIEAMRTDAIVNGDYQGAAELAALLNDPQETS